MGLCINRKQFERFDQERIIWNHFKTVFLKRFIIHAFNGLNRNMGVTYGRIVLIEIQSYLKFVCATLKETSTTAIYDQLGWQKLKSLSKIVSNNALPYLYERLTSNCLTRALKVYIYIYIYIYMNF